MNWHKKSILDVHLLASCCRFQDRIADARREVTIFKCRAVRSHILLIDENIEKMRQLVDKHMLPSDDVLVRPPVGVEQVVAFNDGYIMKALCLFGLLAHPKDLQFVHAFQV
jgi:hypothetical protein